MKFLITKRKDNRKFISTSMIIGIEWTNQQAKENVMEKPTPECPDFVFEWEINMRVVIETEVDKRFFTFWYFIFNELLTDLNSLTQKTKCLSVKKNVVVGPSSEKFYSFQKVSLNTLNHPINLQPLLIFHFHIKPENWGNKQNDSENDSKWVKATKRFSFVSQTINTTMFYRIWGLEITLMDFLYWLSSMCVHFQLQTTIKHIKNLPA